MNKIKKATISHIHYLDTIRQLESMKENVKVSDISDMLGLPRPSVTKTIKDMENLGFVKKMTTKEDGRVVYIQITDSGKACHELFLPYSRHPLLF